MLAWSLVETDWGFVALVGGRAALRYAGYPEATPDAAFRALNDELPTFGDATTTAHTWAHDVVRAYFRGDDAADIALLPAELGGSPLQLKVWAVTRTIERGKTLTYGDVAHLAGYPRAARAAGSALAANSAGLLVPCHRVVAANGIGGYGRHPERKRLLLRLEAS